MRGGQHQALLLLRLLSAAGHSVTLLAPGASPLAHAASGEGIAVSAPTFTTIASLSRRFDLVHVHDARAHTLAALASSQPFLVSRRVAFPIHSGLASRWKYGRAAHYLAVSRFVAGKLHAAGIPRERIDVVYDAVEPREPGIHDSAAPAVALASDDPAKCTELVRRSAGLAGIPVQFATDLTSALQRASMFVYLSHSEGLGSAALLAMRIGIPVIASRVEGLAEVFEHRTSGIYVTNDPGEVADAMRQLVAEPGLAARIIDAARQRVETMFSPQQLLRGTLAAYEKVLRVS
jgi:hypothetical protein